jgi:hypothetical protein
MLYILITASLTEDLFERRKLEYVRGIEQIKKLTQGIECKLCIIENRGKRPTFLDDLGVEVFYTDNNMQLTTFVEGNGLRLNFYDSYSDIEDTGVFPIIKIENKGRVELMDIWDCIKHLNIQDDDYIIKVTGRYLLKEPCPFLNIPIENIDCCYKKLPARANDRRECFAGLIGMRCRYIKQISLPNEESVESSWFEVCSKLPKQVDLYTIGIEGMINNTEYFQH